MNKGNCNGAGEGGGGTKKVPLTIPISSKSGSKKEMQGLILDRYETGKLLGHGTFAKVYLARNVKTNESVAIKVIDKEKILKVGLIGHIKREISILRRVRHPNIVQLFEVMATKSKIYFVMEYVKGGELFGKVAKGRLKEDVARKYFQQLISAVSFCHARGVYHRDLKPENILLDEDGNLKVSDFGLSAISDQIKQDGLFHTFCGTPAYVAPEVLARKGYDAAKVDIWSCGVILYVLIAGYLPFHDRNVMAMYKKIYRGEFRCPKWFHGDLVKFFTHLLDINPQTRMTIPEIMGHKWFRKGFKQVKFYIEDDRLCSISDEVDDAMDTCSEQSFSESGSEKDSETKFSSLHRPASLNAFDIISFSSGFDLSGFFEEGGEGTRFVSGATVLGIISKLEELARVVSFTSRKKNCKISLEGPREGAKGPLTVVAEIFELTPSLRLVEVRKKAGDRSEYEEFYNSELKPVLQNLATEGVSETQEYAEFYNSEVKPGLQNLAIEDASDRPELSEFYNYGLKPGLLNLTVESPSVTTHLPSDTDRPECAEETSKSIQVHDQYVPKPGLPNVTMESDSVMTHLDSDTGRLESAEETSKSTQVHEPYVPKSIPRQQRDTQAADAVPDNLQEHINDLNEMIRNIQPAFQKEDAMPIVLSSTPECREVEMPKEFNKFYNCGPKLGLQTVTMEGPSVMAHLASDTDWPVSAEETSKSIQLHEPNFPKSIPRQQRDTKAADVVNDLKETIQNIQPAYQKEDTMPIALPFTPVHQEVQMAKEFYETYNYGLKPGFQNVTKEGPSVMTHLASDTK